MHFIIIGILIGVGLSCWRLALVGPAEPRRALRRSGGLMGPMKTSPRAALNQRDRRPTFHVAHYRAALYRAPRFEVVYF